MSLKFIIKIVCSLGVLTALFFFVDLEEFSRAITAFSGLVITGSFLINLAGAVGANSAQIYIHVRNAVKGVSRWKLFVAILETDFIVRFYSLMLPLGATAGIRWHRFNTIGIGVLNSGAAIVVNKLQQIFLALLFASIAFGLGAMSAVPSNASRLLALGAGLGAALIFAVLSGFFVRGGYSGLLSYLTSKLTSSTRVRKRWDLSTKLASYMQSYRLATEEVRKVDLALVLIWGVASFILVAWSQALIIWALGIDLDFLDILFVRGVVMLAMMVPFSIAGIGFRELGTVGSLALYGVSKDIGLVVGVVLFGFQLLISIMGGVFELGHIFRGRRI